MKANEVLENVKRLRPSEYEDKLLLKWLGECEWNVFHEIIRTHEGGESAEYNGIESAAQELLVPDAYAGLYKHWLCAKIDENNMEMGRYNASASMYMASYQDFANYWNRTHTPIQRAKYIKVVD